MGLSMFATFLPQVFLRALRMSISRLLLLSRRSCFSAAISKRVHAARQELRSNICFGSRRTVRTVLRDGAPVQVKLDTIVPGDILLIRPGDRVPLDGEVIEGSSLVDESMLTGESRPVNKTVSA